MKLLMCWFGLSVAALAKNPYLAHKDDAPVTRQFSGKEWGDDADVPEGKESIPFRARVTTQRVATMPWGAIYKISFEPSSKREVSPLHFLATDGEILLLASEDIEREIRVIREMARQPKFEKGDVWALTKGALKVWDPPWVTTVSVRGDACLRQAFHENSGHFGRIAWKKGLGLVEFAQGRGAMQDGFELKWQAAAKESR